MHAIAFVTSPQPKPQLPRRHFKIRIAILPAIVTNGIATICSQENSYFAGEIMVPSVNALGQQVLGLLSYVPDGAGYVFQLSTHHRGASAALEKWRVANRSICIGIKR